MGPRAPHEYGPAHDQKRKAKPFQHAPLGPVEEECHASERRQDRGEDNCPSVLGDDGRQGRKPHVALSVHLPSRYKKARRPLSRSRAVGPFI